MIAVLLLACGPPVEDSDRRMLGFGTTFGECVGFCASEIRFSGSNVTFSAVAPEETIDSRGVLTDDGRRVLQDLVLGEEAVEEVYGCPDCDDGGESRVILGTPDGGFAAHRFETGNAPEVFADMAAFGTEILDGMATCSSTPLFDVTGVCEPVPVDE